MGENPIMTALRMNLKKPSIASIETVTQNPNSDITERRLIKKQIPNELVSPDETSVNSQEIFKFKSSLIRIHSKPMKELVLD